MMTASATTEEELQHSSSTSPHLPSNISPNLLLLPSTPLPSSVRLSPSPGVLQSSQQENRRRPLIAVAAAGVETDSVNLNCAAVTVTTSSPSTSCPAIEISSNVINPPSLSETTALVVRHSSCDPRAPLALI